MNSVLNESGKAYDLARIARELDGIYVDYHAQLGSTNDRAIELARGPNFHSPMLVLTEQQLAGRGQRERVWWSSVESATFTWCVEGSSSMIARDSNKTLRHSPSLLPIAAGLAVAETIIELAPELKTLVSIKWPNDVLVGIKKVAGVLVESIPRPNSKIFIVGIGINVNQSSELLASITPEQKRSGIPASSLRAESQTCDRPFDRSDLLIGTVARLSTMFHDRNFTIEKLVSLVDAKISFLNEKITLNTTNKEAIHGTVVGISPEGGLILRTASGESTFFSGSIVPLPNGNG